MDKADTGIVRTTTLEMCAPPASYPSMMTKSNIAIMHAVDIPLPFYRFLYSEVGKSHYWFLRTQMSDKQLAEIVHDEQTHISILYCDGAPAGFAELDYNARPKQVELVYFGLCEQFIGRGLGKWFLGQTVQAAWELKPKRVIVSTDTLDHSHALPAYQKMGFTPISYKDEKMQDWLGHQR